MTSLRLGGLFLFALGLLFIVIWLLGYNGNHNLLVLAYIGAVSFGFGLGLILKSRTKQTPS
jgi:hypothetical protein